MPICTSWRRGPIRPRRLARDLDVHRREGRARAFASGRALKKTGWLCSDTAELVFEDCRIPAENLLGEENRGFYARHEELPERAHRVVRHGGRRSAMTALSAHA